MTLNCFCLRECLSFNSNTVLNHEKQFFKTKKLKRKLKRKLKLFFLSDELLIGV